MFKNDTDRQFFFIYCARKLQWNPDSSVGIVTKLRAVQPRNRGSIPGRSKTSVSTPLLPEVHPASHSMGTAIDFPDAEAATV